VSCPKTLLIHREERRHEFTATYADQIAGTLNGFDRLVFRGTLDALAVVDTDTTLEELMASIQRPVIRQQKRSRALDPFAEPDVTLLAAVSRGDFLIHGIRHRDLQLLLYAGPAQGRAESRRRSAAISRKLRLLRAHGLIRKIGKTHRYQVTDLGREILPAIMSVRKTTLKYLNAKAA